MQNKYQSKHAYNILNLKYKSRTNLLIIKINNMYTIKYFIKNINFV